MLAPPEAVEVDDVRWAFWRRQPPERDRPLPADVGLPTTHRPSAAPTERDHDDQRPTGHHPVHSTSGATPDGGPSPTYAAPLTAPGADVDRSSVAAAGEQVARIVRDPRAGQVPDDPALAVAATGVLAARLPALSGVDGAVAFDEPEDELLHAYADVLASRAQRRADVDRDDLLAVAHLAAAAAAVGAADDPALLLLAGVTPDRQLRAAALLLAQTADDGGGEPDRLATEVRDLFGAPG